MSLIDRPAVVAALEANLRHIEKVVAHLDPETAGRRATPDSWSALDIMEHLAVVERGVHKAVAAAAGLEASELRTRRLDPIVAGLATNPRKIRSPELVAPTGRFSSLGEALRVFRERRNITLDLARSLDVDWEAHHFAHPVFGDFDVGQWFLMAATHGERHALQLEQC